MKQQKGRSNVGSDIERMGKSKQGVDGRESAWFDSIYLSFLGPYSRRLSRRGLQRVRRRPQCAMDALQAVAEAYVEPNIVVGIRSLDAQAQATRILALPR